MVKKIILTLAAILILTPFLSASPKQEAIEKSFIIVSSSKELPDESDINSEILNTKQTSRLNPQTDQSLPDWLKRTNIAFEVGSDIKPKYFVETIQPLVGTQDKDLVFFNQSRLSERLGRPTYNTGFGLRKILRESCLLGINSFYDYQDLHKHSRAGVGIEAITDKDLLFRLNTYIAISGQRLVGEDSANFYSEEVANGLDWEFGSPLPYLPYLKVYAGGYWYNFNHFRNKYGWKSRIEFTPIQYSRLNIEIFDDTKRDNVGYKIEGALTLKFSSFVLKDILESLHPAKEAHPKVNLRDKVLDRVVRDFDITVIRTIKTKGGLTVEGGKT